MGQLHRHDVAANLHRKLPNLEQQSNQEVSGPGRSEPVDFSAKRIPLIFTCTKRTATPVQSPERELVTLLNTTAQAVDLPGWQLSDHSKNRMPLAGTIGPGESVRIEVALPVVLLDQGGLISLLNPDGLRVDGVAYTQERARHPGQTIKF